MTFKHGPIWVLIISIFAGLTVLFLPSWLKSSQDLWGGDYVFAWSVVQEKAFANRNPALWDSSYHLGNGAGTLVPSPQILLSGIVSSPWYMKVRVVFNFVVGAVGMFVLCRRLGLSQLACVFAAVAYMLTNTSCTLVFAGHHNKLDCFAWVPWFLAMFISSQVSVQISKSIAAGGFLGAMLLSGEVQICYYLGLWIVVLWIGWFMLTSQLNGGFQPWVFIRRAGLGILAVVISLLVGYASIVKSLDVLSHQTVVANSTPEANWLFATQYYFPPEEVLSFFTTVQFFGGPNVYWGRDGNPSPLRLSDDYLGILPLGFAILGGISCWRIWQARLFIIMGLGSLLISFGREGGLFWLLYQFPTMKSQRNPHRWTYFVALAVCVLSAYGVQWLWERLRQSRFRVQGDADSPKAFGAPPTPRAEAAGGAPSATREARVLPDWDLWKRGLMIAAVLGVVLFAVSGALGLNSDGVARTFYGEVAMASPQAPLFAERTRCLLFALTRMGFFLAASALATWWLIAASAVRNEKGEGRNGGILNSSLLTSHFSLRSALPWAAVLLVLVADLGSNAKRFIVFYPWKQALEENPLANFLGQDKDLFRVKVIGAQQNPLLNNLVSNVLPYKGIPVVDPPAASRIPNDYGVLFKHFEQHYVRSDRYFDFFNVKYVLAPAPFADPNTPFVPIAQWNGINVYRRDDFFPRAWLVPSARVIKGGEEEILKATLHPLTNLRETVILEEAPRMVPLEAQGSRLEGKKEALRMGEKGGKSKAIKGSVQEPSTLDPRPSANLPRSVRVTRYEGNRVEMETEAAQPTILVLGDKWDPDWKAKVDGQPASILKGNFLMRAVELPAGHHSVKMEYRPSMLPFKISAACILLFAAYGLWQGLRALRSKGR